MFTFAARMQLREAVASPIYLACIGLDTPPKGCFTDYSKLLISCHIHLHEQKSSIEVTPINTYNATTTNLSPESVQSAHARLHCQVNEQQHTFRVQPDFGLHS